MRVSSGLVPLELGVLVTHRLDGDGLTSLELDRLVVPEHRGANLGALGVQQVRQERPLLRRHLPRAVQHLLLRAVVAVRKVKPRHAHPRVDELAELLLVPALGAHRAHDLGLPHGRLGREDLVEGDGGRAEAHGAHGVGLGVLVLHHPRRLVHPGGDGDVETGHDVAGRRLLGDHHLLRDAADDRHHRAGLAQALLHREPSHP